MISEKTHTTAKLLEHLNRKKSEMLDFLKKLVEKESPSSDAKAQVALLQFLGKYLTDLSFFTLQMPGKDTGGYLFARPLKRDKNKPLQFIIGHCDTVWAINTISEMPLHQKNGRLSGPGVYDMKAGLTQLIFAIKAIKELELSTAYTTIVLINSDEEIGSGESANAIRRLAKIADRAFVLEPPLGLQGKLKTARKGLGRFTITVTGKAAHAGLDPGKGANAIVELSHLVQQLYAMNDFEKGITVNVGTIEGGISPNVVAPSSSAVVDVRVLNAKDGEEVTKKIKTLTPTLPDVTLLIEGKMGRPPMERTPRNRQLWRMAKAKGLLLGMELEEAVAGGGSDGNTTSQFTATLDGLGTTGDGAHAEHEFIFVDELPKRTALLTLLLTSDESNKK